MEGSGTSVKIESLFDSNFHTWTQRVPLALALRDLNQYIEEVAPDDDDCRKEWMRGDWKTRPVVGLSLSFDHFEHVSDVCSAKKCGTRL